VLVHSSHKGLNMAVPQLTALPTWYEVQSDVAKSQQEVQKAEEGRISLEDQKKASAALGDYFKMGQQPDTAQGPKGFQQPTDQKQADQQDFVQLGQTLKNYDQEEQKLNAQLTFAKNLQGNRATLDLGMKLANQADQEITKLNTRRKDDQALMDKKREEVSGVLLNINDQQSLDIGMMQLRSKNINIPPVIQVPIMGQDGKPQMDPNTGKPALKQIRTDIFSPELQKFANTYGMSLLDANKQSQIKNQLSEISNRESKQGVSVPNTSIGSSDSNVFKGTSGEEIVPKDDKEKRLIGNLNQPMTKPAAYQVGRNSQVATMAEEISGFAKSINQSIKNDGLGEAGMFGNLKDNTWVGAIGKQLGLKITDPSKQSYTALMKPLARMASSLETAGYGQGGGAAQINALDASITSQPGQDEMTKLQKVGEAANIIKSGLMGASENTSFNAAQREGIARAYQDWNKLIPFNQNDVLDYKEYAKDHFEKANLKGFQTWLRDQGRSFAEKTPKETTNTTKPVSTNQAGQIDYGKQFGWKR